MADTFTANYNLTKPEVGSARDTWGAKQNAAFDIIDTNLKAAADLAAAANTAAGNAGNAAAAAQTTANRADTYKLPIGSIIMWSPTAGAIPSGFVLCDGRAAVARSDGAGNISVPDFRDKFVYGASPTINAGTTGGALNHTHGITVSVVGASLSIDQLPAHSHAVTDPGHTHGYIDPGHSHGYTLRSYVNSGSQAGAGVGVAQFSTPSDSAQTTTSSGIGITIAGAASNISIQNNGSGFAHTHAASGAADTRNHLPPYIAAAFIMRI